LAELANDTGRAMPRPALEEPGHEVPTQDPPWHGTALEPLQGAWQKAAEGGGHQQNASVST